MTDRTQVAAQMRHIIATALRRPVGPDENVQQVDEPLWDSLKHTEIMLMVEETFGVALDPEDFERMTSSDACVDLVLARRAVQPRM